MWIEINGVIFNMELIASIARPTQVYGQLWMIGAIASNGECVRLFEGTEAAANEMYESLRNRLSVCTIGPNKITVRV